MTSMPLHRIGALNVLLFFIALLATGVVASMYPFQGINPLTDLGTYQSVYENITPDDLIAVMVLYEPGFVLLTWAAGYALSFSAFVWSIKLLIGVALYRAAYRYCGREIVAVVIALMFLFLFPPFRSLSEVVVRQGVATAILFTFVASRRFEQHGRWHTAGFVLFVLFFHFSSVFVSLALVLDYLLARWRLAPFVLWVGLTIGYILNIPGELGASVYGAAGLQVASLDAAQNNPDLDYTVGFKFLFLLTSVGFVAMPRFVILLRRHAIHPRDLYGTRIFRTYFLINGLSTFTSMMSYYDRFFLWSWALGPILLATAFAPASRTVGAHGSTS